MLAPKLRKSADKSLVAAFIQPLQYYLRDPAAKDNSITHAAAAPSNPYAATPPLDLQPQIQETHRTTHTGTTTRCRTQRRNPLRPERLQPHPPHTGVAFIAACSHFTRKNTRFRSPASSPTQASPLPFLTTSLPHHFPRSPLPFVTTLCHSLLFFCDVLLCDVKSHTALHQFQVSQFYLSVTRKYCFPTSFDYIYIYIYIWLCMHVCVYIYIYKYTYVYVCIIQV